MKSKKYLAIVEGSKTEYKILKSVLENQNFVVSNKSEINFKNTNRFNLNIFTQDNIDIFILSSAQSRIHDVLINIDKNSDDIEKFFGFTSNYFNGIFLIFDVEHNDCDDLEKMFKNFNDENSGLLLISSPCIEVLGDLKREEFECYDIKKEYTHKLNADYDSQYKCSIESFIIKYFENLVLFYLKDNRDRFEENNIMEHPRLVVDLVNKENIRDNSNGKNYCHIRYFTTVIYVMIAYINGLTKEIDNFQLVYDFFSSKKILFNQK